MPHVCGQNGAIVNVSSLAAAPWHGPGGAAKSAIVAPTRTMAHEWRALAIPPDSVLPGAAATERGMTRARTVNASRIPSDGATPDELASPITFLRSGLASGISGESLAVDRSLSMTFFGGARLPRRRGTQEQ